jgi:hypothetical protein
VVDLPNRKRKALQALSMSFLDNPLFLSVAFHPRSDTPGGSAVPNVRDGTIDVEGSVKLGYRWFPNGSASPEKPVFVYFHGDVCLHLLSDMLHRCW